LEKQFSFFLWDIKLELHNAAIEMKGNIRGHFFSVDLIRIFLIFFGEMNNVSGIGHRKFIVIQEMSCFSLPENSMQIQGICEVDLFFQQSTFIVRLSIQSPISKSLNEMANKTLAYKAKWNFYGPLNSSEIVKKSKKFIWH
jgi:hypothetical protein